MTLETKILRDLDAGQSTVDSLALRLRVRPHAVETVLARLAAEHRVLASRIVCGLVAWKKNQHRRNHDL